MSNSPKIDVLWSPSCADNFIAFGSEITLYKVENIQVGVDLSQGRSPMYFLLLIHLIRVDSDSSLI